MKGFRTHSHGCRQHDGHDARIQLTIGKDTILPRRDPRMVSPVEVDVGQPSSPVLVGLVPASGDLDVLSDE